MTDFENEILAYSLHNSLDFGKADVGKVLPKLFQHGLEKSKIPEIMPKIQEIVKKVNSLSEKERVSEFKKYKQYVKVRVEKERSLPVLNNISKKMVFRLAPFPSGALHIGNARTFVLNALYAEKYEGKMIFVIDDTIGSVDKQPIKEGYKLIEQAVRELGIHYEKPIVYKSDRLKTYYKYAETLIRKNKAYVCHCSIEDLRENRSKGKSCGCREYPIRIQVLRWNEMFKLEEGHGVLRIKTDMRHPNPAFRDRVLFKISDRKHPRVGNKYRVWPTLEMSWAIDDHLLGITHILRGNDLSMETEMEKYIWDILGWDHPEVIHTGLIKIEGLGAKISKSKAQKEVQSGELFGWDDPRTWSIQSLMKRGITKESIREFVFEIGATRQDITVPIESLYSANRGIIDSKTERYSFIQNPKKIEISGPVKIQKYNIPLHPNRPDTREVRVGKEVYVESEDFKNFKNKEVRLLNLFNVNLKNKSEITSIENKKIPRIHWVSKSVPTNIQMTDGSLVQGIAEEAISKLKKNQVIQFERFGFVKYHGKTKEGIHIFWFAHR